MKATAMPLQYSFVVLAILLLLDSSLVLARIPAKPQPPRSLGTTSFQEGAFDNPVCSGAEQNGMVARASRDIFRNGTACGNTFEIVCANDPKICNSNAAVRVKIVDSCADEPNNKCATFVLSEQAFARLVTDTAVGQIKISYQPVKGN